MAEKTTSRKKKSPQAEPWQKVAMAALAQAAEKGWENISPADVARHTKMPAAAFDTAYPDKRSFIPLISQLIDIEMREGSRGLTLDMPLRDRLFEVMMARFEGLNLYRESILSIMRETVTSPRDLLSFFPSLRESMQLMARLAGLQEDGLCGETRTMALLAIYLATLKTWQDDESEDLSRTMAALDKNIAHSETLAGLFGS